MKRQTIQQLHAIQAHIRHNYKRWFKRYSGLQGVNVGIKTIGGLPQTGCYSIVFHVNRKKKKGVGKVPSGLPVTIGKTKIQVPTDVIEAGPLELNGIKMGDQVKHQESTAIGTISLYITSRRGTFACSNMHVLGATHLERNHLYFNSGEGDIPEPVIFSNEQISTSGQLHAGQFDGVDVAFAQVDRPIVPQVIEKVIKTVGPLKGYFDLTYGNISSTQLAFVGISSGFTQCQAIDLGAIKPTTFLNIYLTNLIKLNRCTEDGDSGAPLFDNRNRVAGIIVGRDRDFSYALPIFDVISFFKQSKL